MKISSLIIFISILLCNIESFAQQKNKILFVNNTYKYYFQYPDDWELDNEETGDDIITIYTPYFIDEEENQELDDGIIEQIQITTSRWDEGSLEEYIKANFNEQEWKNNLKDFLVTDKGEEIIGDKEAKWFTFTFISNNIPIITLCYFLKMNNSVISFLAMSRVEEYEVLYKDIYLDIIRSTSSKVQTNRANIIKQ